MYIYLGICVILIIAALINRFSKKENFDNRDN